MGDNHSTTTTTWLPPPSSAIPSCIKDADVSWMIMATVLVLIMFPGLAFFEAGLLRRKNSISTFAQVLVGLGVLSCLWFLVGFSLTFGPDLGGAGILGSLRYGLFIDVPLHSCYGPGGTIPVALYALFQLMFACITPLLITGAIAERMSFKAFLPFVCLWEIFVYYPVAHWIWSLDGWLAKLGTEDFAGGIVIHTTAGIASLVAAYRLGHRQEYDKYHGSFPHSNLPLACIGAAMLWAGWFGFNGGSATKANSVAVAAVINSQVAASSCAVTFVLLQMYLKGSSKPSVIAFINGAIGGLAGVTPASGFIRPPAAFLLGIILAVSMIGGIKMLHRLHIDDALEVTAVHGVTGLVGALYIGIAGDSTVSGTDGIVASHGKRWTLLGAQLLGILVALVWAGGITFGLLVGLERFLAGGIRAGKAAERRGLDINDHDEKATISAASFEDDDEVAEDDREEPLLGEAANRGQQHAA